MHRIGTTYVFQRYGTKAMQDAAFRLPRIFLPRTPVNKGMKRGRGCSKSPSPDIPTPLKGATLALTAADAALGFFGYAGYPPTAHLR
jgi:hypothetical protein